MFRAVVFEDAAEARDKGKNVDVAEEDSGFQEAVHEVEDEEVVVDEADVGVEERSDTKREEFEKEKTESEADS